ncbi:hypothetical protein BaRGS_00014511, partial [Batillaria attramentaria]
MAKYVIFAIVLLSCLVTQSSGQGLSMFGAGGGAGMMGNPMMQMLLPLLMRNMGADDGVRCSSHWEHCQIKQAYLSLLVNVTFNVFVGVITQTDNHVQDSFCCVPGLMPGYEHLRTGGYAVQN